MGASSSIYIRLNGEQRGPFGLEQLRELAEAGVVTPQSEASTQAAGPWTRLQDLPGCTGIFPERRQFQFKAREFEPVNRADAIPVDHRELIAAANRGRNPPLPGKPPTTPNDVIEILQENTRVQLRHERPVDPTRPPNRRRRDYLLVMTVVNGCFAASLFLGGGGIFALSGMVIASSGITWVMFGVMDRY